MTIAGQTPDQPKVSRPIRAEDDSSALEKLLRGAGCRLPSAADLVEELVREVEQEAKCR